MQCLHPHCPANTHTHTWVDVVNSPELNARVIDRPGLLASLNANFNLAPTNPATRAPAPTTVTALMKRLVDICPCLVNQTDVTAVRDVRVQAQHIVHLCELTLGGAITSENVEAAFQVQHPGHGPNWAFPPAGAVSAEVGSIMEMLCSEVLANSGLPVMPFDSDGWPEWNMPGHILLNYKKMNDLKALGDVLIPCAPTNLIVSVKAVKARERLLYSANSIEGIGFGFFDQASEFSSKRRIQLFKRMGFSAIYMPQATLDEIAVRIANRGEQIGNVQNIYGSALYRSLTDFGEDMRRIVGKSAFDL